MKIRFPKRSGQRYWAPHFEFLVGVLEGGGWGLDYRVRGDAVLGCGIGDREVLFEYSDLGRILWGEVPCDVHFKFHCWGGIRDRVLPFSPVSFHDWGLYERMAKEISYTCNSGRVLNRQRIFGNARGRRRKVQKILKESVFSSVHNFSSPSVFWKDMVDCLVSVCVPGQREDILDRGQLQYMGLGCCTVSPKLKIVLAYDQAVVPGVHYVECAPDYADLVEVLHWCKAHQKECVDIGQNAKELFIRCCTPKKLVEWIEQCVLQ